MAMPDEEPEQGTEEEPVEAAAETEDEDGGKDAVPSEPRPTSDPKLLVEGMLFSAGHAMQVIELEQATGLERREVLRQLRKLASEYRRRNTAMEVAKVGSKWTMQLKVELTPQARSVAPPEIPPRLLKTLALIAYHQPMRQSDLQEMVGPKVYDQVRELVELGLVVAVPKASTKSLTTTQRFLEYFGIPSTRRDRIKRYLAERMGITLPEPGPAEEGAEAAPEGEAAERAPGAAPTGEVAPAPAPAEGQTAPEAPPPPG
jgi:segregation and condensation protein B